MTAPNTHDTVTSPGSVRAGRGPSRPLAAEADAEGRAAAARRRRKNRLRATLMYLLLTLVALPFVFPVYWMLASGLKPLGDVLAMPPELWPSDPQWSNLLVPFQTSPFLRQMLNSLFIATAVMVLTLAAATCAGYAFARIEFRGRGVLFIVLLTALLLPAEVTILPLFKILDAFGWIDSPLAVIIPEAFGAQMVFGIFLMRQFFISLPHELDQAGRVDGLGRYGLFFWIALPLARAPMAALGILAFLASWNDLLGPMLFLRSPENWTVPLALINFTDPMTSEPIWNMQMAATFLSVAPVLLVFFLAQRQFIEGIAGTGIK